MSSNQFTYDSLKVNTIPKLKEIAKSLNLKKYSALKKDDLINLIVNSGGSVSSPSAASPSTQSVTVASPSFAQLSGPFPPLPAANITFPIVLGPTMPALTISEVIPRPTKVHGLPDPMPSLILPVLPSSPAPLPIGQPLSFIEHKSPASSRSASPVGSDTNDAYKFRAETINDIVDLLNNGISFSTITIKQDPEFPDVDVTVVSDLELEDFREELRNVPDGHVMVQTLNYADQYTGERDYDIE